MRSQELLEKLISELQRNCGDTLAASKVCGVSLTWLNQWRKDDKVVDEDLREAERMGTQGLVSAAIARAVNGYEKDVYYKGEVVGQETVYSDTLLQTLLKAKVDDFKPQNENAPQVTVNIANLMPRATSYEEWLTMRDQTAQQALPRPVEDNVIDVDFKAIEPAFAGIAL